MSRLPGPGETFGRYRLLEQLGAGGMGVVYAALDQVLNRRVALKLVLPHHAADPEFRSRFAREAETQARLDSSHVVSVYDYGEHDGVLYLCTQLVEGGDLASRVAVSGALAPELAVEVTGQVLAGLEEAHRAGVVHRDVKPANVLLRQQGGSVTAHLCDFGIATMAGQALTQAGQVIGSLPWMAPERHYGEDPGPVGDVYSAGCVLFYALTGAAPYVGSDGEVMRGHLEGEVPQLAGRSAFARKANAVLARSLAKVPAERYPTAAAMAADVRALAAGAAGEARAGGAATTTVRAAVPRPAAGPRTTAVQPTRRRVWVPVVVAATVMLLLLAGAGLRAVLDDQPAQAAGATQVEVAGRTVTLQPTRTISPLDATPPASLAPDAARGPDAAGVPDAAAPTRRGSGAVHSAPVAGAGTGGGTQVAPPPADRYRCSDGTRAVTLGECPMPATSYSGAQWIFGKMGTTLACRAYDRSDTTHDLAAWTCSVPGHPNVALEVVRWDSAANAKAFYGAFTRASPATWTWGASERIGSVWTGQNGTRYRLARLYDIAPWSINWSADSAAERGQIFPYANDYQYPGYFRGEPL